MPFCKFFDFLSSEADIMRDKFIGRSISISCCYTDFIIAVYFYNCYIFTIY